MPTKIEDLLLAQQKMLEQLNAQNARQGAERRGLKSQPRPIPIQRKHSGASDLIANPPPTLATAAEVFEYRPIYDIDGPFGGFFQDGSLERALVNLVVYPTDGLANQLPVRPNNVLDDKHGFLVRYSVEPDTNYSEGDVCDPAIPLTSDYDFMKMGLDYGRLSHAVKTLDITNLILRAQQRQYDDFYIVGDWRGVSARPDIATFRDAAGNLNQDLIVAAALRRKLADLGTYFQRWVSDKVWTGDPANTAGGKQILEPYGLYRLINGDYSTAGLPITTTAHLGGPAAADLQKALSSIVVDLDGKTLGDGTWSSWRTLSDVEQLLYMRAKNTGLLPVQWKIYMITPMWNELVKHISCEMVADGCTIPNGSGIVKNLDMNGDGGTALFNMTTRQQLMQSQTLTLNGRTYEVVLDDTMPYEIVTDGGGNFIGYKGDIFFIPFTAAGGEQVLYWEYVDFSQIYSNLQPISDRALDAKGWTDNGFFYHQITTLRECVEMQTTMRMRLIFRAPHLAARMDGITAGANFRSPMYWDGAGQPSGWLVPPAA